MDEEYPTWNSDGIYSNAYNSTIVWEDIGREFEMLNPPTNRWWVRHEHME